MTETLALKYRPRTFADVAGQKAVRAVLNAMVNNHEIPTGLLFAGERGTGKTTMGRILAAALNCEATARPCGHCPSCKATFSGASLTVLEVDAASNGTAADIRRLMDSLRYTVGGNYRVVLLDEAHSMSNAAFNAILKDLEEPPAQTVFVLLTTEPHKIPDTVRSRLMYFEFKPISDQDLIGRLEYIAAAEQIPHEPDLMVEIADRSYGGLRDAVMLLDQAARVGISSADQLRLLLGITDFAPSVFAALDADDLPQAYDIVDTEMSRTGDPQYVSTALISCLKDLLVLAGKGELRHSGAPLQARQDLAHIPKATLFRCIRTLWELKTRIRVSDAPRESLYLALAMMHGAFHQDVPAPKKPVTNTPMSLSDLKAAVR